MSSSILFQHRFRSLLVYSKRYQRGPFGKPKRSYEEKNRPALEAYKSRRLELAEATQLPVQWALPQKAGNKVNLKVVKKENKLLSPKESASPYQHYQDAKPSYKNETYYDPLFNPNLHEDRNRIDPEQEPFKAIYADEQAPEYTAVRNITTPQLWEYVERLARIKIAPMPQRRKDGEEIIATPSGYVPQPENPPDLPYFVARTRNHLLPVYYSLYEDPDRCCTMVKQVTGDLWKFQEDLRTHLESLNGSKKIATSVHETDDRVLFRGKHLHQVVDWLHKRGF